MSSRTPRPAFKGALSGSLPTNMRPSWRFGPKACPRLPESRQPPAQNAQICIAGGDAVRSTRIALIDGSASGLAPWLGHAPSSLALSPCPEFVSNSGRHGAGPVVGYRDDLVPVTGTGVKREVQCFGAGSAVVLGQHLAEGAWPVGDDAVVSWTA
jgi:hypothetical protein